MLRFIPGAALLVVLASITGCQRQPATSPAAAVAQVDAEWPAFTQQLITDYFEIEPFQGVNAGRHEFDGKMPDVSERGLQREVSWLTGTRARVVAFDAAKLSAPGRLEREILLSALDDRLFWMDRARFPFTNPAWYINSLDPDVYLSRQYAPLERRLAAYIDYARAIPGIAAHIRTNLQTPMPRSFVERGIAGFGGYADFYRNDVPKVFAAVADPALQKALAQADEAAAKAMDDLKSWLESERARANEHFALGQGLFAEMLKQTEQVNVPLGELEKIGRADLDRNLKALREACELHLPRAPLRVCVDSASARKPAGGAVEGARTQLVDLKKFILDRKVVTIPGDEDALVNEAPPYNRANSAYINVPGPYEKGTASIYYVAPPDPKWSAQERAAYVPGQADLLYTSVHEVWPGHFLQYLHSNRNPSKVAALWLSYAYVEGWAHYAEEMMWDEGLGSGDPEQHVGQLTNALLRNVRFVCAIGLHTQGMTIKQCEQMFRDDAFQDPGNARQQAARGTYDPGYLNYTLGKLMIRKLRADWVAKQPAVADPRQHWREFHDRFLSYGGPPIPLVRKEMVGEGGTLF